MEVLMEKKVYKYKDFGDHLKRARRIKYSNIKEFSRVTGISLKNLYEYERGRVFPPIEKLVAICKCLNRSPNYMLYPLLNFPSNEEQIIKIFEETETREMLKDQELAKKLKFALNILQILHLTRKHFNMNGDMVDYLEFLKDKLFNEGQIKKIK